MKEIKKIKFHWRQFINFPASGRLVNGKDFSGKHRGLSII
jgi:hypothetical protein